MIAWMLYALAVATLLTVAARALETALKLHRMPARWAWAGALTGALVLPALTRLWPGGRLLALVLPGGGPEAAGGGVQVALGALAARAASGGVPATPELRALLSSGPAQTAAAAVWAVLSLSLLGLGLRAWRELGLRRRDWEEREVDGTRVMVSADTGPAVAGLLRPRVVLPAWVLEADPEVREMIVRHEREHLRAGDSRLLAAGLLAVALVPWNLPLWWALRRLRLTTELDCDRRVLEDGTEPRAYGSLLVAVSGRPADLPLSAAALGEPKSLLERRIRAMTRGTTKFRHGKTVLLALLAAGLVAVACDTPNPLGDGFDRASEAEAATERADARRPAPDGPREIRVRNEESGISEIRIRGDEPVRPERPASGSRQEDGSPTIDLQSAPLVFIDGERVERDGPRLGDLRPEEIESIEVIKGPAAERLYGPEAADGVIRITTKAGSDA